jgi:hypothetical protein
VQHVETQAHGRRGHTAVQRIRAIARNVVVASASVLVLALLAGYALAGPTPELSLTVGPVVPQPGATAVVQGRFLEPDDGGLSGVRVLVRRGRAPAGESVTSGNGRFRVELRGGCGVYRVSVEATWQGSKLDGGTQRRLCPGDALPLDGRVITQGHVLWVPGPR